MQAGSNISLPSHRGIDFPRESWASDVQNKRIYRYDVYLWEKKIEDGFAMIAIMPCVPKYPWESTIGGMNVIQNCAIACLKQNFDPWTKP